MKKFLTTTLAALTGVILTTAAAEAKDKEVAILVEATPEGFLFTQVIDNVEAEELYKNRFFYYINKSIRFDKEQNPGDYHELLKDINPKKDKVITSIWVRNFDFSPTMARSEKVTRYCAYAVVGNKLVEPDKFTTLVHDTMCEGTEERLEKLAEFEKRLDRSYLNWDRVKPVPGF